MYFAKLVGGKTYNVMGHNFLDGIEQSVDKPVYEYLSDNHMFEVREGEAAEAPSFSNGEKYTEIELKKLNKTDQEDIISSLTAGDFIQETKNEKERIELILQLQKQNEQE
ncbi:hypothetical protein CON95_26985 [Bacillus toyonensis]|uniref:YqbF domain-containing protein n=1 Tax=Bacillus toyonensis TaxID=155322 RepID=UPI000BED94CB|nr:YqbF domain-containing protein [Bacillus toyonensis]PEE20743.1 hypothetical protein CON95_26985 [Bacillus toyonensis]